MGQTYSRYNYLLTQIGPQYKTQKQLGQPKGCPGAYLFRR
ncbi:uncharacterized protein METZ01_LOCUS328061, partial [marine metagenome]